MITPESHLEPVKHNPLSLLSISLGLLDLADHARIHSQTLLSEEIKAPGQRCALVLAAGLSVRTVVHNPLHQLPVGSPF